MLAARPACVVVTYPTRGALHIVNDRDHRKEMLRESAVAGILSSDPPPMANAPLRTRPRRGSGGPPRGAELGPARATPERATAAAAKASQPGGRQPAGGRYVAGMMLRRRLPGPTARASGSGGRAGGCVHDRVEHAGDHTPGILWILGPAC